LVNFVAERKAEGLGNDKRKTMLKIKTADQTLPFKNGTALPSPSQAPGYIFYVVCFDYICGLGLYYSG